MTSPLMQECQPAVLALPRWGFCSMQSGSSHALDHSGHPVLEGHQMHSEQGQPSCEHLAYMLAPVYIDGHVCKSGAMYSPCMQAAFVLSKGMCRCALLSDCHQL